MKLCLFCIFQSPYPFDKVQSLISSRLRDQLENNMVTSNDSKTEIVYHYVELDRSNEILCVIHLIAQGKTISAPFSWQIWISLNTILLTG